MKSLGYLILLVIMALAAGCAAPGTPSRDYPGSAPRWENPAGIYDTGYRQWFDMPYYNPYAQ